MPSSLARSSNCPRSTSSRRSSSSRLPSSIRTGTNWSCSPTNRTTGMMPSKMGLHKRTPSAKRRPTPMAPTNRPAQAIPVPIPPWAGRRRDPCAVQPERQQQQRRRGPRQDPHRCPHVVEHRSRGGSVTRKTTLVPRIRTRDIVSSVQFFTAEEQIIEAASRFTGLPVGTALLYIAGRAVAEAALPLAKNPFTQDAWLRGQEALGIAAACSYPQRICHSRSIDRRTPANLSGN